MRRRWWLLASVSGVFTLAAFLFDTPLGAPAAPRPLLSALVGCGVGLAAGRALALLLERFDRRVRSAARAGELLGLAVLGRLPALRRRLQDDRRLVISREPEGGAAEALRDLRSTLERRRLAAACKTLLVTSSRRWEGKTPTLCDLALTLALAGRKVVVVDADLRDPQLHRAFSLPNKTGLTTLVQGTISLAAALRTFDLGRIAGSAAAAAAGARLVPAASAPGTLLVLTSGPLPADPGEVIGSERMAVTLKRLANSGADVVLVNAPPLLGLGDAALLAPGVDGLLFVADLEKARRASLEEARAALAALPCRKLGLVALGGRPGAPRSRADRYSLRDDG